MVYRSVETSTWDDPKVRVLPSLGKLLFVYLFTNRHSHVSGIYVLPPVLGQYETGLKPKEWDTLCDTLSSAGLCRFDGGRDVVWVVNGFRYQGRGEKNDRAAARHMLALHNSPLINDFLEKYPTVRPHLDDRVCDRASEVGSNSLKEQEQEKEQEKEKKTPCKSPKGDERDEVISFYRQANPDVTINESTKGWREKVRQVENRLKDGYTVDQLKACIVALSRSEHHQDNGYRGLEYVVRSSRQVEKMLGIATKMRDAQPRELIPDVPPGSPLHGRKAGEEWRDNGTEHSIVREGERLRHLSKGRDGKWKNEPIPSRHA